MSETNEWVDEDTHLDTSTGPKSIIEVEESQTPVTEVIDDPTIEAFEESEVPPKPEAPEPVVYDYGDGSSAVIEKDSKGWKATLDAGTGGQPEVFRGHTKDEMYQNLMAGKINATKKIREQSRKIKLGVNQPAQEEQVKPAVARKFNADDVTQLKIELQDDPDVALDNWFQKKTGKSLEQITQAAARGESARMELHREQVGRAFATAHPNYYSVNDNYVALMGWLTKYKIAKHFKPDEFDDGGNLVKRGNEVELLDDLVSRGLYTLETLSEAFEDLKEDGLLVFPAPAAVEKPTARVEEEPEVVTPTVIRRPRGSLGIRGKETSTMPIRTEQVLNKDISYADLDKLSTKEIEDLMRGIQDLNRDNPVLVKEALQRGREKQPR